MILLNLNKIKSIFYYQIICGDYYKLWYDFYKNSYNFDILVIFFFMKKENLSLFSTNKCVFQFFIEKKLKKGNKNKKENVNLQKQNSESRPIIRHWL